MLWWSCKMSDNLISTLLNMDGTVSGFGLSTLQLAEGPED